MRELPGHPTESGSPCGGCSLCETGSPEAAMLSAPYSGWKLVGAASWFFLCPAALGIAGAAFAGADPTSRWFGGVAGLAAGMLIAGTIGRRISRRHLDDRETPQ